MNDKKLQEIESRAAAITPGERDFDECDECEGVWHVTIEDTIVADYMTCADAKFFAHAPADIRWLIEQLKAAREALEGLMRYRDHLSGCEFIRIPELCSCGMREAQEKARAILDAAMKGQK